MSEEKKIISGAEELMDDELETVNGGFGIETGSNDKWVARCRICGGEIGPCSSEGHMWAMCNYHDRPDTHTPCDSKVFEIWHNGKRV